MPDNLKVPLLVNVPLTARLLLPISSTAPEQSKMLEEVILEPVIGLFVLALMNIFAVVPGTVPPAQLDGVDQLVEVVPLQTE